MDNGQPAIDCLIEMERKLATQLSSFETRTYSTLFNCSIGTFSSIRFNGISIQFRCKFPLCQTIKSHMELGISLFSERGVLTEKSARFWQVVAVSSFLSVSPCGKSSEKREPIDPKQQNNRKKEKIGRKIDRNLSVFNGNGAKLTRKFEIPSRTFDRDKLTNELTS